MEAIVVLSCLNEEASLQDCCASLGFGVGDTVEAASARLVLIDNGSEDSTSRAMRSVLERSPAGRVFYAVEVERGYVPGRRRAIKEAARLAGGEDVLIVQVDADTIYEPGYVAAMLRGAEIAGPNTLVQGLSEAPSDQGDALSAFSRLCRHFDEAFDALFLGDEEVDVVVDDKVCAYRLSDYRAWGGHTREFDGVGEEVLGETTRLLIAGMTVGARLVGCDEARARTSARRDIENPGLVFATAGWPRSHEWRARWTEENGTCPELLEGRLPAFRAEVLAASRARHLLGMFGALPRGMRMLLGGGRSPNEDPFAEQLARLLIPLGGVLPAGDLITWSLEPPIAQFEAMYQSHAPDLATCH